MRIVEDYLPADTMPADRRHETAAAWPQLEQWLGWLDDEGKRPRTIHAYDRHVAVLLRLHPDTPFDRFTPEQVTRALRSVPQPSRYIPRSVYKGWFEWGELLDYIEPNQNPMRKVAKMKAPPRRPPTIFSVAEIALLTGLPVQDGALFTILFGALLRREDAITLKRGNINLDTMLITIYGPKGERGRVDQIPISPAVAAAVADLDLLLRLNPDDHLWYRAKINKSRKTGISTTEFSRWYGRCLDQAGVAYRRPHITRHTGHWLLKHVEELDLEERRLVLRHKSIDTTTRQYPAVDVYDVVAARAKVKR